MSNVLHFGWNHKVWSRPFLKAIKQIDFMPLEISTPRILEIGCNEKNLASLILVRQLGIKVQLHLTCYLSEDVVLLEKKRSEIQKILPANSELLIYQCDIFEISEKFDFIVLKSVLGGLFRNEHNRKSKTQNLLTTLCFNNLKDCGKLITLDNAVSFFEYILSNCGARKNKWMFFEVDDFEAAVIAEQFGFLSCFSLQTRIGIFGKFLEDNILFQIDLLLERFGFVSYPTVICNIFEKANKTISFTTVKTKSLNEVRDL